MIYILFLNTILKTKFILSHYIRLVPLATHPDQFNVLNSARERKWWRLPSRDLLYHHALFEDMDYPMGKMVLHIGSTGGKEKAIERFIENLIKPPKRFGIN